MPALSFSSFRVQAEAPSKEPCRTLTRLRATSRSVLRQLGLAAREGSERLVEAGNGRLHGQQELQRLAVGLRLPGGAAILCGASGPLAWAYKANTSFDTGKTGVIRVSDLEAAIERARKNLGNRWLEIAERVDAAVAATQPVAVAEAVPPFVLST